MTRPDAEPEPPQHGVVVHDHLGAVVAANPAALALLGLSHAQAFGRERLPDGWSARHADGAALDRHHHTGATVARTQTAQRGVLVRVREPGGAVRLLCLDVEPTGAADGAAAGAVTTLRDVTRTWARPAPTDGAPVVGSSPIGMLAADHAARLTTVNAAYAAIVGTAADRLPGTRWEEGVHPEDRAQVLAQAGDALRRRQPFVAEHRVLRPDGTVRWVRRDAVAEFDAAGRLTGFSGTLVDLTERRRVEEELRAVVDRHRQTLRSMRETSVGVYGPDLRLMLLEGEALRRAGVDVDALEGRHVDDVHLRLLGEETMLRLRPLVAAALAGDSERLEVFAATTGRLVEMRARPYLDADGAMAGVVVVSHDITAQRLAERARREEASRFRAAFDRAPIGMAVIGLDGCYREANDALLALGGHSRDELLGRRLHGTAERDDGGAAQRDLARLLAGELDGYRSDARLRRSDGTQVEIETHVTLVRDDDGAPSLAFVQMLDLTERRRHEQVLRHLADHDPLTGLLNRRGLERVLGDQLARARRYGARGALLILDLDGFKVVNDTLGHSVGDELIIAVARRLRARLRDTDTVARLGGDEFAVLVPEGDLAAAEVVAKSLVAVVREVDELTGRHPGRVTGSVGIAAFGDPEATVDDLLVRADLAMYDAKDGGRDQWRSYGGEGQAMPRIQAHMSWLSRMRQALVDDRFELHAQPLVALADRSVVGHELLLRLRDEEGELVPPGLFLPIAERFDLIQDVDRFVIGRALEHLREAPQPLNVNLSARSMGDAAVLELLRAAAADGVALERLTVEVTETAAVADLPRAQHFARELRSLGCRLALDDFGAGFGSFYYLKHIPFDVVKIDGEFVRQCATSPTDRMIIRAVCGIARGLGKDVVAEHVPDEDVIALLRDEGVAYGQGFFLGRPAPFADLAGAGAVPA